MHILQVNRRLAELDTALGNLWSNSRAPSSHRSSVRHSVTALVGIAAQHGVPEVADDHRIPPAHQRFVAVLASEDLVAGTVVTYISSV